MASPPSFDPAPLLAPISEDAPTGVDLRETDDGAEYYRVRGLRREASDAQKTAAEGEESERGAAESRAAQLWQELGEECVKALSSQTKDLEFVAWLIESELRQHGFAGLRDGFRLATGLVNAYWDTLWSLKDDGDGDPTVKGQPIALLNGVGSDGTLLAPMRSVPITPNNYPGPFAFWQADAALRKGDLSEIEANAREADRQFYPVLLSDIAEAKAAVSELTEALREKMGSSNMPPTSSLRDAMDAIAEMVRRIAGPMAEEPVEADGGGEAGGAEAGGGTAASGGKAGSARPGTFETREQAFAMLLAVAKFFRDREPHSPLSYTLEEAVRRGRLPLPELLSELLGDLETRNRLLTAAGIKPPPPPEEG
jgi:type VI secretion system protein ImpA